MDIPGEAKAIEKELREAGLSIQTVLDAANLDRSTWTRWKSGAFAPRLSSWIAFKNEATRLLAERRKAAA